MFRRCREPGVVGDKCDREALQLLCRYSNLPTQLLIDRPDLLGPLARCGVGPATEREPVRRHSHHVVATPFRPLASP